MHDDEQGSSPAEELERPWLHTHHSDATPCTTWVPALASVPESVLWANLAVFTALLLFLVVMAPCRRHALKRRLCCQTALLYVYATVRVGWAGFMLFVTLCSGRFSTVEQEIDLLANRLGSICFFALAGLLLVEVADALVVGWKSAQRLWAMFRVCVALLAISSVAFIVLMRSWHPEHLHELADDASSAASLGVVVALLALAARYHAVRRRGLSAFGRARHPINATLVATLLSFALRAIPTRFLIQWLAKLGLCPSGNGAQLLWVVLLQTRWLAEVVPICATLLLAQALHRLTLHALALTATYGRGEALLDPSLDPRLERCDGSGCGAGTLGSGGSSWWAEAAKAAAAAEKKAAKAKAETAKAAGTPKAAEGAKSGGGSRATEGKGGEAKGAATGSGAATKKRARDEAEGASSGGAGEGEGGASKAKGKRAKLVEAAESGGEASGSKATANGGDPKGKKGSKGEAKCGGKSGVSAGGGGAAEKVAAKEAAEKAAAEKAKKAALREAAEKALEEANKVLEIERVAAVSAARQPAPLLPRVPAACCLAEREVRSLECVGVFDRPLAPRGRTKRRRSVNRSWRRSARNRQGHSNRRASPHRRTEIAEAAEAVLLRFGEAGVTLMSRTCNELGRVWRI